MNREAIIERQIEDSIYLKRYLQTEVRTLIVIAEQIIQAMRNGNKVLLFGNGGSAADAQHIACELVGKLYHDRDSLPAMALTTNTSLLTAIANDYGYDSVFVRQLQGLVKKGDIVIGLSTSGRSRNVLLAMDEARRRGAVTIAFTCNDSSLVELVDYAIAVPSTDTPRIQEAHITAGHIICYLVEEAFVGVRSV